ncbi:MAG: GNAT family N-acetyltransferase [Alphaproteobacteria bacterium]|nr:GNAT family N-acetyltransferase [Alphaproteobacteria bacterium]MDE2013302.1 GNAT family N-acetyltransferase [Alphaproteobacteria bacterium]MDE2072238.1 GNAT family N-acetyltransferase [Alphaproteobacteria bacterium]MDE2350669.1 GNAT family N-acetyltransferase [Alphaproteobacteria bacterium]
MSRHRLETERLLLRPPEESDVALIAMLAGDYEVSKNLARVPHPYTEGDAQSFVTRSAMQRAQGTAFPFAIIRKDSGLYLGGCGLHLMDNGLFELGYWLGRPHWGRGYATEAARKVAGFAFHGLRAVRLTAGYFHDNPASGRVLEKLGFRPDGAANRDCLARGHTVYCLDMLLERENFGRRPSNGQAA